MCLLLISLPILAVSGCRESAEALICDLEQQRGVLYSMMRDWYIFNDEPEQQAKYASFDINAFASTWDMLGALRWGPDRDNKWTYITTAAQDDALGAGDDFPTFGFWFDAPGDGTMLVQMVFERGPAQTAGLRRGDAVLAIDRRPIAAIEAAEGIAAALDFSALGTRRTFTVQPLGGVTTDIALTAAMVPLPTIVPEPASLTSPVILSSAAGDIGYLPFVLFVGTAPAQLDAVFAGFAAQSVRNLVVDLRYSPGGAVVVADHLAALLAGPANAGRIQEFVRFNAARSAYNQTIYFGALPEALELDRIIFITTGYTASAGEGIINALKADGVGIDVAVVGERTAGKAAGQIGLDFCDGYGRFRVLAVEFFNADNEGQFYDGLPVDCEASDDLTHELGDPAEASLAAAIAHIETGGCGVFAGRSMAPGEDTRRPRHDDEAQPWRRPRLLY